MRFLLLNQFFPPDDAPTGQLLSDVARALAAGGHSVTVVCAGTAYADGGHAGGREAPGFTVRSLPAVGFGHGHVARLSSYASFYVGALYHTLFGPRPDVVLTLTTPPLLSLIGTLMKLLRGARHFSWEMDVYPDIAVDLAVLRRGSFLDRAIGALADFSRRRADRVIALGASMRGRLIARGTPSDKIAVAENWADGSVISPRPFPPHLPLTVLYSGNLGRAHDVDTIEETMESLADPARFRFVFAGAGPRRDRLEARCRSANITSAVYIPYQDRARLGEHLGSCHIGLVTQHPATCGSVVPSKTYALMAAGRPFLYIGPAGGTPAQMIERFGCGWRIEPGDSAALVDLLQALASDPDLVHAAGGRARQAFLEHYDLPQGVGRILDILGVAQTSRKQPSPARPAAV
ncbi:MAG: glycosyltransferase family 4 protein [Bryobacteraceae bacterium]|jgi:glycosyltransferase involved in cell wall biosynthesis